MSCRRSFTHLKWVVVGITNMFIFVGNMSCWYYLRDDMLYVMKTYVIIFNWSHERQLTVKEFFYKSAKKMSTCNILQIIYWRTNVFCRWMYFARNVNTQYKSNDSMGGTWFIFHSILNVDLGYKEMRQFGQYLISLTICCK